MNLLRSNLTFALLLIPVACTDDAEPDDGGGTSAATGDSDGDGGTGGGPGATSAVDDGTAAATGDSGDGSDGSGSTGEAATGIPVLGNGSHSLDNVIVEVVGSAADALSRPTDCEFHPAVPGEMWVTNMNTSSMTIFSAMGTASQTSVNHFDPASSPHFLARPSALAFGTGGMMATAQMENEVTQPSTPWDFMGPTLWTSDSAIFDGGHLTHTDMLHNSPNGAGIAWEADNVYWYYDGEHRAISRYDFQQDHGLAGTDHTDGRIYRTLDGEMGFAPLVAAHLALDHTTSILYAADPALGRIVAIDTQTGELGEAISPNYDAADQFMVLGVQMDQLITGEDVTEAPMLQPSGLELFDDILFVSDHATGVLYGFSKEGELLDWLPTAQGPDSIMGMCFDTDGTLYVVDATADAILHISPSGA